MLQARSGLLTGIIGGVAGIVTAAATVWTGAMQTDSAKESNSFNREVSNSEFVKEFTARSSANAKDIEYIKKQLEELDPEMKELSSKLAALSVSGAGKVEVGPLIDQVNKLARDMDSMRSAIAGIGNLDELSKRVDELSQKIGGSGSGYSPSAESVAAALMERYRADLTGPPGPKGDAGPQGQRGPKGDQGAKGADGLAGMLDLDQVVAELLESGALVDHLGSIRSPNVSSIRIDKVIGALDCIELDKAVKNTTGILGWGGSVCLNGDVLISLTGSNGCTAYFATQSDAHWNMNPNTPRKLKVGDRQLSFMYSCVRDGEKNLVYPVRMSWD